MNYHGLLAYGAPALAAIIIALISLNIIRKEYLPYINEAKNINESSQKIQG